MYMSTDGCSESTLRALEKKLTTAEQALSSIQSGDRIFVGTACATPRSLIKALESPTKYLGDVQVFHFLTDGAIPGDGTEIWTRFQHKVFFVGADTREAVKQGKADYIPISLSRVPRLIENGRIPIDVALVQVSPPDEDGFVSLGISVDITRSAVQHARRVFAELNPNMPRTRGDSLVHLDRIDHLLEVDTPIIEYVHEPVDSMAEQVVASYCVGTRRLYDLVHNNPAFFFAPIDYVCDPAIISQNPKMVSVTQAFFLLTGPPLMDA
jgi:acyl-CoA hydrolase